MNADKARICQQLSAYLDGELGEAEARQVRQAVQADEDLAREMKALASVRQAVRGLAREPAGEDFVARVMEQAERTILVRPAEPRPPGTLRWVRWLATAAVLLVAASVGILIAMALWAPPGFDDHLAYHDARPAGPVPPMAPTPDDRERTGLRDIAAGTPADLARRTDGEDHVRSLRKGADEAGDAALYGKATLAEGIERGRKADGETADLASAKASGRLTDTGAAAFSNGTVGGTGKMGPDLGSALATVDYNANNEVIYTDRLGETQRQIEKVLVANGIVSAAAQADENADAANQDRDQVQARSNFFHSNQLAANTYQYEVFITPDQLAKVQDGLNTIRARQKVSQSAARAMPQDELRQREEGRADDLAHADGKAGKEAEHAIGGRAKALGKDLEGVVERLAGAVAGDQGRREPPAAGGTAGGAAGRAGPARPAAPAAPELEERMKQDLAPTAQPATAAAPALRPERPSTPAPTGAPRPTPPTDGPAVTHAKSKETAPAAGAKDVADSRARLDLAITTRPTSHEGILVTAEPAAPPAPPPASGPAPSPEVKIAAAPEPAAESKSRAEPVPEDRPDLAVAPAAKPPGPSTSRMQQEEARPRTRLPDQGGGLASAVAVTPGGAAGGRLAGLAPASAPASTARRTSVSPLDPSSRKSGPAGPDRTWWGLFREQAGRILAPRMAMAPGGERAPARKPSPAQSSPALEPLAPAVGVAGRPAAAGPAAETELARDWPREMGRTGQPVSSGPATPPRIGDDAELAQRPAVITTQAADRLAAVDARRGLGEGHGEAIGKHYLPGEPSPRPAAQPRPVRPTTAQAAQPPTQEKLIEAASAGAGQSAYRFRADQGGQAPQTAPGSGPASADGRQAPAVRTWHDAARLSSPMSPQSQQVARLQRLLITVNLRSPEESRAAEMILKSNLESRPANQAAPNASQK